MELPQHAIDLHVHSAPDIFPRLMNDWQLGENMRRARMRAMVLKSHTFPTADRTALVGEKLGLPCYGGIACNYFVGGFNPLAVDAALRLGAKIVWMPTISSKAHYAWTRRPHQSHGKVLNPGRPLPIPPEGLSALDESGRLRPEVGQICELVAAAGACLATGHLEPGEIPVLFREAKALGVERFLLTHPDQGIAPVPLEMQKQLARHGALLEKCYLCCMPEFADVTPAEMAERIRATGPEPCALVTDFGQAHNKNPVAAMEDFVRELLAAGIPETWIERMLVQNPAHLLGLEATP